MFSYLKLFTSKKKILLISHELSNTGAPRALLNLARTIKELGYFVFVISYIDGPLKEDFSRHEIPIVCMENKKIKKLSILFKIFDMIICNTILCYPTVAFLEKKHPKVLWWIHEAIFIEEVLKNIGCQIIEIMHNANIYCVSEYAKSFIKKYNDNPKLLELTIDDEYNKYNSIKPTNKKIKIIYMGELVPLKGQDIFIDYFSELPLEIQNLYEVNFIGEFADEEFSNKIKKKTLQYNNIKFLGKLSHEQALKELASCDLFILLSRGDSFSIATAEALMLDKPIIISNTTGIATLLQNENCGYIIRNKEDFIVIMKNLDIKNLKSSRKVFLKKFSKDSYKKYIKKFILTKGET